MTNNQKPSEWIPKRAIEIRDKENVEDYVALITAIIEYLDFQDEE